MKNFKALIVTLLMLCVFDAVAGGYSVSSRSSSFSSSRPSSYSAPRASAPISRPTTSSASTNQNLKSLGFQKPQQYQAPISKTAVNMPVQRPTTKVNTNWYGGKSVSSAPAYKAPARVVSSPVTYRPATRTVVVNRNYYNNSYGGGYGYNRNYGGGSYGSYGGYGGGGSSFLYGAAGAVGGVMLYNALSSHSPHAGAMNTNATEYQLSQARADQRIEDKLDQRNEELSQILANQRQQQAVVPQQAVQKQGVCFLPPDAPLMMSPQFYCQ